MVIPEGIWEEWDKGGKTKELMNGEEDQPGG